MRVVVESEIKDLVSIVVPVYNAEAHLAETLDCLAAQTYLSLEIVLVDDGSKDGSRGICETYVARDSRFKYIYQKNSGAGAARNLGLDYARGEFLMFLDADDLFEPNLVECLRATIGDSADVAVCGSDKFSASFSERNIISAKGLPEGIFEPLDIAANFYQKLTAYPWDKIFRAKHIKVAGLRFQTLRYSNDSYFVLMALLRARRIVFVPDVLVHYRMSQGGSLRDKMYLDPCCDLVMLDCLRPSVAESALGASSALIKSLDAYTIDNIYGAYRTLATQSAEATAAFQKRLWGKSLKEWEASEGRKLQAKSFGHKVKLRIITHVDARQMVHLLAPLGANGLRTASFAQKRFIDIRLILASFRVGRSAYGRDA